MIRDSELTTRVFGDKFIRNYTLNMTLDHKYAEDLKADFLRDEWVIVAAGPSLNDNVDFIKESVGKRTICAINASLKWFYLNGVKPDLCTACDPNKTLIPHIESLEKFSEDIPLIADCSTNHGYMEMYAGPKYFVVSDSSMQTEEKRDCALWSYGGTVTSLALEVAFRFGAKKIYLVGADLAYPGKETYAEGVGHENSAFSGHGYTVISVEDTIIPTSDVFCEYIHQIEKQIRDNPDVEVVNRSFHGAYLRGTYCNCWWEDLPESEVVSDYLNYLRRLMSDSYILGWSEKYYLFRQVLTLLESKNIILNDEEESSVMEVYSVIFDSFRKEMNVFIEPDGSFDKDLEFIIIDEISDGIEEKSRKLFELAKSLTVKHKNVLIINTFEKIGGKKIPIHNTVDLRYNTKMEKANKIFFGNKSFPYYQFPEDMPDTGYYGAFLESTSHRKPGKIYTLTRYSLLADMYRNVFGIPIESIY